LDPLPAAGAADHAVYGGSEKNCSEKQLDILRESCFGADAIDGILAADSSGAYLIGNNTDSAVADIDLRVNDVTGMSEEQSTFELSPLAEVARFHFTIEMERQEIQ